MANATDVDGDDWRALSIIPATVAPLKVGLMSTAVMANIFLSISPLKIVRWFKHLYYYVHFVLASLVSFTSITNHFRMLQISQITASVQAGCLLLSCAPVRQCVNIVRSLDSGCVDNPRCFILDMYSLLRYFLNKGVVSACSTVRICML